MEFLNLFDDCLITVFSYCDVDTLIALSQTCKRLERIVKQCHFPIFPNYRYCAGTHNEVIERFGKYVRDLWVFFEDRVNPINNRDYCEFLAQNVGDNIKKLEIMSDGIVIPPLELLAPILKRLNVLVLSFNRYNYETDEFYLPSKKTYLLDLSTHCPNLEELTFSGPHRFPPNCGTFSKLKSLTIASDFQNRSLVDDFLEKNRQITQICFYRCDGDYPYIDFDKLTRNLVNLEKLRVAVSLFQYLDHIRERWTPQMLGRLQKLKVLHLERVSEHFYEILAAYLSNLTELTSISMYLIDDVEETAMWQQAFVQIARDLKNLQFFSICKQYTKEVSWDRNTIIDFVRLGSKLKAVYFQKLNFPYTTDFLKDLVEARKFANPNAVT